MSIDKIERLDMFEYTTEGYAFAKKWLEEIGEWHYVSTHGFSVDGWSIVATANAKYKQLKKQMEKKLDIKDIQDLGFVFKEESEHMKSGKATANESEMECIQGYTKDLKDGSYCHMHLFNQNLKDFGRIERVFITDFGANEKPFSGYYEGGIGGYFGHIIIKNKTELEKILEQIGCQIKSNTK